MTKRKFHVHVYKVVEKAEVDTEATDETEAMSLALKKAKSGELDLEFGKSDCQYLAMPFEARWGSDFSES